MTDLERHYRVLLRAYPRAYRAGRGDEMVATHLEVAARRHPGRRWPTAADAADIVAGGLRQRLRAGGAGGIIDGAPLAAPIALGVAVMFAAMWLPQIEVHPAPVGLPWRPAGPFLTLGGYVWVTWLLAAASAMLLPGRVTRALLGLALGATVAVIPISAVTEYAKPPMVVLFGQFVLGLVALRWRARPGGWARVGVLAGTAAGAVAYAMNRYSVWYWQVDAQLLIGGAAALLVTALVLATVLTAGADTRGWWALVILLIPAATLSVWPVTRLIYGNPTWLPLAATTLGTTLLTLAVVPAIGLLRRRVISAGDPQRVADRILRDR